MTLDERKALQKKHIQMINEQSWVFFSPIISVQMIVIFIVIFWR